MNNRKVTISMILVVAAAISLMPATVVAEDKVDNVPEIQIDKSGYVEVDNGRLYYEIAGEGSAIVMIHDGILHRETWDFQWAEFVRDYRLIRYDRRGYGKSDPFEKPYSNLEDLRKLFSDLGIEKAVLLGCSAGGGLAIDFALAQPEAVEALVLVGAVVSGFDYSEHTLTRGGKLSKEIWNDPDAFRNFWYHEDPYSIYEKNTEARKRAAALLDANPHNISMDKKNLIMQPEKPALNRLSEIAVPTLYIAGEYDIPDVHALSGVVDVGIPNSQRIIINDAGHLVHMEHPDQFNSLVRGFLAEGYLARGDTALAVTNYRRAQELNSENEKVKLMLKKLEE